ncbi:outer membrane protein assembly factor [Arachidicoccus terrestris]|nr:outer membrane protein assembly factor [Arachidicoccus terrestris]
MIISISSYGQLNTRNERNDSIKPYTMTDSSMLPAYMQPDTSRQQAIQPIPDSIQMDIWDLYRQLFHKQKDSAKAPSAITVVPNISANPTIGFQIGIKAVAGKVLGKDPKTYLSVAATSASITTKNILYFYLTHNIFTNGNKYNLQGALIASKSVTPDFGLGSRPGPDGTRKGYVFNSQYYQFKEKIYKELAPHLYGGAGLEFDIRRGTTMKGGDIETTPYGQYNARYGFRQDRYNSNGFLFDVQYTTRDNQNRAFKGIYANAGIRLNQTWIGSTKNATQLNLDLRKYVSLSQKHPEHILAFWTWSSFVLGGRLPYLELPGTGRDINFRSGRGYTISFFKGTQFFYYETEYRFPITRNQLLSGVTFFNLESVNDESVHQPLFHSWQPGGGAGLRILFNKATRTNLCLDYAFGKFGKKGFFLGLNEAF